MFAENIISYHLNNHFSEQSRFGFRQCSFPCTDDSAQCCSSSPTEFCRYRAPDCLDYRDSGETRSGVYRIIPPDMHTGYDVYCDMKTDGGGWMVSFIFCNTTPLSKS